MIIAAVVVLVLLLLPAVVAAFLRDVDAGTIRLVSWLQGSTVFIGDPASRRKCRSSLPAPRSPAR